MKKRTKKNKMLYIKEFFKQYGGCMLLYAILTILNVLFIIFYEG